LVDAGIDGVLTDEPELLREIVEAAGTEAAQASSASPERGVRIRPASGRTSRARRRT
jgi:hypothetical protein